jgi:hypothetical protein
MVSTIIIIMKLPKNINTNFDVPELAPEGTFEATCANIRDELDIERKDRKTGKAMPLNITRFLFEFIHNGKTYQVQTYEMAISGNDKSRLFQFLLAWLGQPPQAAYLWGP